MVLCGYQKIAKALQEHGGTIFGVKLPENPNGSGDRVPLTRTRQLTSSAAKGEMNMTVRKILVSLIATGTVSVMTLSPAFAGASMTRNEAIAHYNKYYDAYAKDELVKIQQYRTAYSSIKGSLADQIVERAIWYMENGYMVYGSGYKAYATEGIVDCSNFTSLVYGDFGINLTTTARKYNTVGTRINGVSSKKVNGYWTLQGTQNLLPGDILTWWAKDKNGNKYISHVAIYIGMLNGQPAVIGTRSDGNPTAIGIVNDFRWWWGSNFFSAQRVLPEGSWTAGKNSPGYAVNAPVIPANYVLPPQKPIVMPGNATQPANTGAPADNPSNPVSNPGTGSSQLKVVSSAYIRVEPRLSSQKIALIKTGTLLKIIKKYNNYYYLVETPSGQQGYITASSRYVSPLP